MNVIIAEANKFIKYENQELLHAYKLDQNHPKYQKIVKLFQDKQINFFLNINEGISHYINKDEPLVIVTDWSDPTEMIGIALEENNKLSFLPNLGFIAFHTDWSDFENSGIKEIFSHELSHLWLYNLGFDINLSKSNNFHTITSITDQYIAFSEGFAEHLEIVSRDLTGNSETKKVYDNGLDIDSWISYRDSFLRVAAVKNNRFIYHTATPFFEDYEDYGQLHLSHITSSAFTPERIKNGSQMLASEGVIASFFYYFYINDIFKNTFHEETLYKQFGFTKESLDPLINHYLKIIYVFSKMDMQSETLLIDFIIKYGEIFGNEKEAIYNLFLEITNYVTVDINNREIFQKLYLVGKSGNPIAFKEKLVDARKIKSNILLKTIANFDLLKKGLYPNIWVESDKLIKPVPWKDKYEKYKININTATNIDLLAFDSVDINKANEIIKKRITQNGFGSLKNFYEALK